MAAAEETGDDLDIASIVVPFEMREGGLNGGMCFRSHITSSRHRVASRRFALHITCSLSFYQAADMEHNGFQTFLEGHCFYMVWLGH